jgi:uncharacterized protein
VIHAVIDTNVLVSALISPSGNEALIVLAISQGLIKPYFSAEILREYSEVLPRPKFSFSPDEVRALIGLLNQKGECLISRVVPLFLPDPADLKFLACAQIGGVNLLVTGNKRHFPPESCGTVEVVSAGELLDRLTLETEMN